MLVLHKDLKLGADYANYTDFLFLKPCNLRNPRLNITLIEAPISTVRHRGISTGCRSLFVSLKKY